MYITRVAIDLAKDVFQLCGVDEKREVVFEKRITSRQKFKEFMAKLGPCEVRMEACGSSNYWARLFSGQGFEVKLISPQYVKPYVQRNKNDLRDARGIMEASFWPSTPYVTPKTVEQQDIQSLLRVRNAHLEMRTMVSNQLRGLLKEYGIFIAEGYRHLRKELSLISDKAIDNGLSDVMKELVDRQYGVLIHLDEEIDRLDIQLKQIVKENTTCERLQEIAGIGPFSALAMIALVGDGKGFKNGRHFAAYLGLVPKQHSSGRKNCLLGISKRGDNYLRQLLIHGGRSIVRLSGKKTDARSLWMNKIKAQGGANKAAVAIANKNARIAMSILLSGERYKKAA